MESNKEIIQKILHKKIQIEKIYELKHPGSSSTKVFTIKNSKEKYLLKSYESQKHTNQETKNLFNIELIDVFDKPKYVGRYKKHYIQEYVDGLLFQNLVDKLSSKYLHKHYLMAVENLVLIHSSKNNLKDKRKVSRVFEEKPLERRLNEAIVLIKKIGIPSYKEIVGSSNPKWDNFLKNVNISNITQSLKISGDNYFLGHGDYKPNNIIFGANKKIFTIDWLGMSKAQPWYDLAYLLVHLKKTEKDKYLKHYFKKMKEEDLLQNLTIERARRLFKNGIIFQQIIRAESNCYRIKSKSDKHHIKEFKEALDELSKKL
ncbi:MAG: phosphotransferase [Patescibacteria group bacterium]|jgi:thiamine kinase-like enzyme|nr:phosphotransferase [Patescibacteria group bacterium]